MLDQVVRERGRALFGFAYVLTGDRHEAEDLLQEALVRAFRSGRHASSVDAAQAYVKRSIVTASIDRSRRAAARPRLTNNGEDLLERERTLPASSDPADAVGAAIDLQAALMTLSPKVRACVALRFIDDLTVDSIAQVLGLAPGTVKRYLSDAREQLRAVLPSWDDSYRESAPVHVRRSDQR